MIVNLISLLTLSILRVNGFHIMPNTLISPIRNQNCITKHHQFKLASTPSSATSMYVHNQQPPRDPNPVFPTYDTTSEITNESNNVDDIIPKITPASKFFNLEEMEDKEVCTTEVFLSQNGSVTLTETNGPPPVASYGHWSLITDGDNDNDDGSNTFEMTVTRTYSSGRDHTAIGEFTFDVTRTYIGDLSFVGSLVSVEGSMHMQDEFKGGDVEVGFFSMIDTTAAKLGEEDFI